MSKIREEAAFEQERTPLVNSNAMGHKTPSSNSLSLLHLTDRYGIPSSLVAGGCFCLASGSMVRFHLQLLPKSSIKLL
jgi:hypothetical protein